jgi:hypothetical protein
MPENIEIFVVSSDLKKDVLWTVPLVQYFLDKMFVPIQLKANRPFICLAAGITLNVQPHPLILAYKWTGRRT